METEGFSALTFLIIGLTALWGLLAFGVGKLAEKQGRDFAGWFIISLIISPFIVALVLLLLGKSTAAAVERAAERGAVKIRCTECGAAVDEGAQFCPSCGSEMPNVPDQPNGVQREPGPVETETGGNLSTVGILLTLALMVLFALTGVYTALQASELHRGLGLLGGMTIGLAFAYGTRKVFPGQITT